MVALGRVQPSRRREGLEGSGRAAGHDPRDRHRRRGALAQELSKARQGKNDFDKSGYGGPCPPGGTHHYVFRLYALDAALALGSDATRAEVLKAIAGHILAEGRLVGTYKRGGKE